MHKLIILIETPPDEAHFEARWPAFIQQTAAIPNLRRETTSRVSKPMFGSYPCYLIHELYFDHAEAAKQSLESPAGRQAGRTLQWITGGRMTLLLAEHLEGDPASYQPPQGANPNPASLHT